MFCPTTTHLELSIATVRLLTRHLPTTPYADTITRTATTDITIQVGTVTIQVGTVTIPVGTVVIDTVIGTTGRRGASAFRAAVLASALDSKGRK